MVEPGYGGSLLKYYQRRWKALFVDPQSGCRGAQRASGESSGSVLKSWPSRRTCPFSAHRPAADCVCLFLARSPFNNTLSRAARWNQGPQGSHRVRKCFTSGLMLVARREVDPYPYLEKEPHQIASFGR
jgi:hypothetical protein